MMNKLTTIALSLLVIIFSFFTIQDLLVALPVMKDGVTAAIFLVLAILSFEDNSTDQIDSVHENHLNHLSDHKTLVFIEWFSFCMFWIFISIYQLVNSNLIIGVIAFICLCYWSIINITKIVIYLFLLKNDASSHK